MGYGINPSNFLFYWMVRGKELGGKDVIQRNGVFFLSYEP